MALTQAGEILRGSADEAGWTVTTQLEVVCQFLDKLASGDPLLLRETFRSFLDGKINDEIEAEVSEKDEKDDEDDEDDDDFGPCPEDGCPGRMDAGGFCNRPGCEAADEQAL